MICRSFKGSLAKRFQNAIFSRIEASVSRDTLPPESYVLPGTPYGGHGRSNSELNHHNEEHRGFGWNE
jgi:hypothetical protein